MIAENVATVIFIEYSLSPISFVAHNNGIDVFVP